MKDLIAARLARGGRSCSRPRRPASTASTATSPTIHFKHEGRTRRSTATSSPAATASTASAAPRSRSTCSTVYDREFPFGWLGILSESPPLPEMTYSNHDRGFALASRRSPQALAALCAVRRSTRTSRTGPTRRIWDELHIAALRQGRQRAEGRPILQKGITPCALVRRRRRCATAGCFSPATPVHIVPPTGAKGLNLAVADVRVLSRALIEFFRTGATGAARPLFRHLPQAGLEGGALFHLHDLAAAPAAATRRRSTARSSRPSWTTCLSSLAAQTTIAENYVGLPFEED